ncbi:MAG: MerR family transcriptional regulator [Methanomicrobiaceae archaeon]|nr:MerR family transcriptional regulator [Methanomicrobiaceae archaeon]
MKIDYFRISDIAKRTGIPEERVAEYARDFDAFLTYATEGATKLYTPDALLIMERIDGYFKQGMTAEEAKEELDREFPQLLRQKTAPVKETECPDE